MLEIPGGSIAATTGVNEGKLQKFGFADGSSLTLHVEPGDGFTLFRLESLDLKSSATGMELLRLPVSAEARINPTLNAAFHNGKAVGMMSATPEVLPIVQHSLTRTADLKGCTHRISQTDHARERTSAAEFTATCTLATPGWSMQGSTFPESLPLESVVGLSAWVHGDGKGQQLKFQLVDDGHGARDYYVPINFTGWRQIDMTSAALSIVQGKKLVGLNLYYNGIPASTGVTCLIDDIRAFVNTGGTTTSVQLESFEAPESGWWTDANKVLSLQWDFKYAGVGHGFGIIACPENEFFKVVQRLEKSAGILTPYPGGEWNKQSQAVRESYLFLTSFSQNQFDQAVEIARLGGFKRVLLGQESWCQSTGHYKIKRQNFPDGLPGLKKTVERFRNAGIDVGLHLLGASIDSTDPFITPVPDLRLFKDARTTLTSALDPATTTITVADMPAGFPEEDGGYTGDGTVLQIGSELIHYQSRTSVAPYTFSGCVRGYLGTRANAHAPGDVVHNLARSYGYHMFDMDTSILDEVTSNFAAVANGCDIGMVYFDGSERLQGDHARYNSRLINAYLSKLKRKDILVQASSFAHFSWHQLARTASADGHGDLKGYLEQRSPSFSNFKQTGIPLDIGWYYGYDTSATLDMYEYILGTTIGYDSSFSYQVSVAAADKHPFTTEILDLTRRYEELRLSGRVPEYLKLLLQVPKELQGKAPDDPSRDNKLRRDYRLVKSGKDDVFQRVTYGDWQSGGGSSGDTEWQVEVTTGPATVGMQLQALESTDSDKLTTPTIEINGQRLQWAGEMQPGQYVTLWPGEPSTLNGKPLSVARTGSVTPTLALASGTHKVRFSCGEGSNIPFRVRIMLTLPERHVVPPAN